jgi:galactose mutarotase-like enzyme
MLLKNDSLEIIVVSLGAELQSIKSIESGTEYLWQADPEIWGRHAPILFPIVGRLKDDTYKVGEQEFRMGQHGFARDMEFDVVKWNPTAVVFSLKSSSKTFESYPFHFDFRVGYKLDGNSLIQSFEVINTDNQPIPFSFGAHPAFIADPISDYHLEFGIGEEQDSDTVIDGIRTGEKRKCFEENKIQLSATIFNSDALIFSNLRSNKVILKNSNDESILEMLFEGFPFLGIWAKPGANYVCIEPWCGIADKKDHNKNIFEKEGIMVLPPGETERRDIKFLVGA